MLHDGLYEQIISKGLDHELANADKLSQAAPIDTAEASKVLAKYVAEVVERGLDNLRDNGEDLNDQVTLANQIITIIQAETKEADFDSLSVAERAEQLLALFDRQNSIWAVDEKAQVVRPETSIAQSSLFTGAVHEPQMYTELKKEIVSCNRIDMLVSFIKWSGLRLIMDELTTFTQNGGELRIITTSYMGATDVKAIEELRKLPNTQIKVSYNTKITRLHAKATDVKAIEELRKLPNTQIKVSYNTKITRLHAKAYIFYRDTGFTTAYVGSSNLSNGWRRPSSFTGTTKSSNTTMKDSGSALPVRCRRRSISTATTTRSSIWRSGRTRINRRFWISCRRNAPSVVIPVILWLPQPARARRSFLRSTTRRFRKRILASLAGCCSLHTEKRYSSRACTLFGLC